MKKIVLASGSPRRKALLEQVRLKFTVDPNIEEEAGPAGLSPERLVEEISRKKAESVASKHHDAIIISADTVGVLGDRIIGKPGSESQAREILSLLSGKAHKVITGFTIIDTSTGKAVTRSVETKVFMKRLKDAEIEAYVKTREPMDKAGAYAIQGLGAVLVEQIEGDYSNVMGLPLAALAEALKEFGVNVL